MRFFTFSVVKRGTSEQIRFHCVAFVSTNVVNALDKHQTTESKFHISKKLHLLNNCWQVSKGKIKLYINVYFLGSRLKSSSTLLFESCTICTHLESLVHTMECNLRCFFPSRLRLEDLKFWLFGLYTYFLLKYKPLWSV